MNKITNMNKLFSILFSITILFSISIFLIPSNAYGEEIDVKSVGIEETTILTITNESIKNIKTIRVWLSQDVNFESFKTEKGWVGEKTPQGVIIFTSSETIKINETVKFGFKTDKSNPVINWKVLDQTNEVIDTGVNKQTKLTNPIKNSNFEMNENKIDNTGEILSDSTFRIIPEKPNVGSTIRVTGDNFGASQIFDFYIDSTKIGNFETDENGYFITTMQIPNTQTEKRVEFTVVDKKGKEKTVSLRLSDIENRIPITENIKITVNGVENIIHRGELLEISGTGQPNSAITVEIINPQNEIMNSRTAEVNSVGNWNLEKIITIPFDAEFGKYSIKVSDGRSQILKNWNLETDKIILIHPTKVMFDAGELIKFNGTALPNKPIELILEDHLGNELDSKIITVDESGYVEFEYQSTENDDKEGTWTLIAIQQQKKEFTYVGYDELPSIPVNITFDKTNYKSTESAEIILTGKPAENLNLIIINPSGGIMGKDKLIQLRDDGRAEFKLELTGYGSGIYTAVIQKGNSQTTEKFSVGLQLGSGNIDAKLTKMDYQQGERILLLGNTNPNVLLNGSLIDPSGKAVKTLEIATDKEGVFSEEKFKIPVDGTVGTWKIKVSSGNNLDVIEFEVFSLVKDRIALLIEDDINIPGFGKNIKITLTADHKTSIITEIINEQGEIIDKLNCNTTAEYKCQLIWTITKEIPPGTYTIRSYDSLSEVEKTFRVD
ncbi:biofilm-associated protein [Nitrosopumilus sp.]|nr:biofilm-associated protein [Nitrosopumilus sp.]MDB4840194.1 biofilm-associated protein [Nitrosopumilus sp.]